MLCVCVAFVCYLFVDCLLFALSGADVVLLLYCV